MDYSKAKKKHPKLKVRNVKRLIAAIRESDHLNLARARAEKSPLKIGKRGATCADASINMASDIGKSRVPLVFDMSSWLDPAPVAAQWCPRLADSPSFRNDPACGTAACIAGFAATLAPESILRLVEEAIEIGSCFRWEIFFAEFLGIDTWTAGRMTSVQEVPGGIHNDQVRPRHAVRLLETFLRTGEVDWCKAMGMKKDGSVTKVEEAAFRRENRELEAMAA